MLLNYKYLALDGLSVYLHFYQLTHSSIASIMVIKSSNEGPFSR